MTYDKTPDPENDAFCAELRTRMIKSGQIVPGPREPKFMNMEQIKAWKMKLFRLKAWTPLLLRAVAMRTVQ